MNAFMVDVQLPESLTPEFRQLIPHQRKYVNHLMKQGIITSYSVSYDRRKLWVIVHAESLFDVKNIIGSFPIFTHIRFSIHNLLFHDSNHMVAPQLWLN